MSQKKRALGRGLDSLIGPSETRKTASATERRVLEVPLHEIRPNINQPRKSFDETDIVDLANSIREKGILQPLLVRRHLDGYELIAGERRFRAAKSINLGMVPCIQLEVSDAESCVLALIENIQRENLNAMEEAHAYQSLIEQFNLTQEEVAVRVGKNRSTVTNALRLMSLPVDIQEDLHEGRLSAGHARAVLQIPDRAGQRKLRNLIISKDLSVREAETMARAIAQGKKPARKEVAPPDPHILAMQEEFSLRVGLPVVIKASCPKSGKLEIPYRNLDEFQLISNFFGS